MNASPSVREEIDKVFKQFWSPQGREMIQRAAANFPIGHVWWDAHRRALHLVGTGFEITIEDR